MDHIQPFHHGLSCNDVDITHPYYPSDTVVARKMHIIATIISVLLVRLVLEVNFIK